MMRMVAEDVERTTWPAGASARIYLDVTTPYNNPTVRASLFKRGEYTTPLPGEIAWPVAMAKVPDEDTWEVFVPEGALRMPLPSVAPDPTDRPVEPGDKLRAEVEFDDGPDNRRTFVLFVDITW